MQPGDTTILFGPRTIILNLSGTSYILRSLSRSASQNLDVSISCPKEALPWCFMTTGATTGAEMGAIGEARCSSTRSVFAMVSIGFAHVAFTFLTALISLETIVTNKRLRKEKTNLDL